MAIFIFIAMIFCHIVDDFYLQGILAKMKQKKFWEEYDSKYECDYIVALIIHGFSWAFMIMLPVAIFKKFDLGYLYIAYPVNMVIHCIVDDLKANKHKINLLADQTIHFMQIVITFWAFIIIYM